jgi:hypothetical protein
MSSESEEDDGADIRRVVPGQQAAQAAQAAAQAANSAQIATNIAVRGRSPPRCHAGCWTPVLPEAPLASAAFARVLSGILSWVVELSAWLPEPGRGRLRCMHAVLAMGGV